MRHVAKSLTRGLQRGGALQDGKRAVEQNHVLWALRARACLWAVSRREAEENVACSEQCVRFKARAWHPCFRFCSVQVLSATKFNCH